jgi:serine/threonine protein kinase
VDPQGAPIDRYVVLEYLAEGGMGAIYLGKKLGAGGFEKQVVLKQLLPEFTRQPEFIDLFLREARLSATLDHANIIHTIDLVTAGDEHFIVMEYLDGADLRTLLKRSKRRHKMFSAAAGIYVARELLSALAYAHNKVGPDDRPLRLIHRDISPSNILISGNGEVKLTDFGIAKAATHNSVFYRVKGKFGYMSPEQARSEPLDARSDLYSLAVCLFEMMTGQRLFVSAGLTTSAEEMYSRPIPLISKLVDGMPSELDKVMLRALSVDPDHRYQTAAEFQEALLRCAHRHGLMMSAPELAEHLRMVCGPPSQWREQELSVTANDGTELYDQVEGTQQLSFADDGSEIDVVDLGSELVNINSISKKRERAKTSMTKLGDLRGIELTSLAKFDDEHAGAEPLVDLDSFGGSAFGQMPAPVQSLPNLPTARPAQQPKPSDSFTGIEIKGPTRRADSGSAAAQASHPRSVPEPAADVRDAMAPRRTPWMMVSLILLLGLGTAAAIGLSGPAIDDSTPSGSEMSPEPAPKAPAPPDPAPPAKK